MSRRRKSVEQSPESEAAMPSRSARGRVLWFVVVFVVLVIVGSAAELYVIRDQKIGHGFQAWVAGVVGAALKLAGVPVNVHDTTLTVASRSVVIAVECTGIRATAIFWAGVIGFPCPWRRRLIGLAMGLFGVGLLNMLRIALLGLVMGYRSNWFELVHAVLMQGFLVVFVGPLWIFWMLRVIRK